MSAAAADLRRALSDRNVAGGVQPGSASAVLAAAEAALARGAAGEVPPELWHEYLDATAGPAFLQGLGTRERREAWVRTVFAAIRASDYSLRTMLRQRASSHPDRPLFIDGRESDSPSWSFAEVERYTRGLAGVFTDADPAPRVAILCENGVDGACSDIACLAYGIPVSPLNVHLDDETLAWIVERLDINVVVTDTDERHARMAAAAAKSGRRPLVFRTGSRTPATLSVEGSEGVSLRHACARIDLAAADARLAARPVDLMRAATVMFTSGSTGRAKGVVFSEYMLLAKRFARAAALPAVGNDEVLLCYLPLFHTFGRFLEMLGMLYWRGTYIFAGNPSAEALIAELGRVRPTGLISVPVRWQQIRDHCLEAANSSDPAVAGDTIVRQVVGGRLRWGLSAAGHLDAQVFRFFQRHGIDLCSGFGMTEATGGITMTPPGAYEDGTVGVPLPGIETRLSEEGELHIAGAYVASYLDEAGAPGVVARPDATAERWLATGDLFHQRANGYLAIVDRLKDIYKNTRGQTVAPQRVERRFADVPGVRRAFLAGDHRDHNVLLIVPDRADPLLAARTDEQVHEYFAKIVAAANTGLAPYERVVNFALLDRDFDVERGELTPKGSFRRSVVAANFAPVIERLYQSNHVDVALGELRVRIPRWLFRDLGVLEQDIVASRGQLRERRSGATLRVRRGRAGAVRIGDLEYALEGDLVDLGMFVRQPRLWLGNPALVAFAPCRSGWDVPLRNVSEQVRLPQSRRDRSDAAPRARPKVDDVRLQEIHALCSAALHDDTAGALPAIGRLATELAQADPRSASAIRRRLEALAFHRDEAVRALAYRTLVLDLPVIDYDTVFPAFLESGRTFLTESSIVGIASARHGERRLQGLRQRLYSYRTRLAWPGPAARRRQLRRVFRLLANFARHDLDHLNAVRAELAAWALFRADPPLARSAQRSYDELTAWLEDRLRPEDSPAPPQGRVVFAFGTAPGQRQRLERMLFDPTFLRHSIMHAFNDDGFAWDGVAADGVWVSPLPSQHELQLYRVAINLRDGRHFDLLLAEGEPLRRRGVRDTILWLTSLSSHPFGAPSLPRFGAWRRDLGAVTIAFLSDLSAWDRIRELCGRHDVRDRTAFRSELHKLYVRAMSAFFRAWEQAGRRIVPGALTPANVVLPDADFHERTSILSLAGWRPCDGPLALLRPLLRNFFRFAEAHYPALRGNLQAAWIFEACTEALGTEAAAAFLDTSAAALAGAADAPDVDLLLRALNQHRQALAAHEHVPLPVIAAIDRYAVWERANPAPSARAREESVIQMLRLYRIERFPDAFRYHLYRHTYFAHAAPAVDAALARLVRRGLEHGSTFAGQLEELSRVQALMEDADDRGVFSRMVFPHAQHGHAMEVLTVGAAEEQRIVVRSQVHDDGGSGYVVREPLTAAEVGQLYRLVMDAGYRMRIREQDRQLVLTDREERIVGGLAYRWEDDGAVAVEAIVVASSLASRGLGGALIEDFCVRVAAHGARLVRTNFFLGGFFAKHGFHVNQRWGGVVRFLTAEE